MYKTVRVKRNREELTERDKSKKERYGERDRDGRSSMKMTDVEGKR